MLAQLALLIALFLTIKSAWMMAMFIRLRRASKQYDTTAKFESSCHMTIRFVNTGFWMGILSYIISFISLIVTAMLVYRHYAYSAR